MDSNITVCRDLMPPRLLLRLVPPPLLQPQARALARYVFDDFPWGEKGFGLHLYLSLPLVLDALWALRNSLSGSRRSKVATFLFLPPGIVKNSACPFMGENGDLAGSFRHSVRN
jgi:hypothetical protein